MPWKSVGEVSAQIVERLKEEKRVANDRLIRAPGFAPANPPQKEKDNVVEPSEGMAGKAYLRFTDLVAMGICNNWPTLLRWIEKEGFPTGFKIGNTRLWALSEINEWLETRRVSLAVA